MDQSKDSVSLETKGEEISMRFFPDWLSFRKNITREIKLKYENENF